MALSNLALEFTERGIVPDGLVRAGIRRLLRARLEEVAANDPAAAAARAEAFAAAMRTSPIALLPHKANEQHYEVPSAFFGEV
ncbi:MAG TPA: SAM-dependent methyltransferase, partial [Ideonella sp.]|nr:SAM-dependent methyltransferase [Ideonella sp.]